MKLRSNRSRHPRNAEEKRRMPRSNVSSPQTPPLELDAYREFDTYRFTIYLDAP